MGPPTSPEAPAPQGMAPPPTPQRSAHTESVHFHPLGLLVLGAAELVFWVFAWQTHGHIFTVGETLVSR